MTTYHVRTTRQRDKARPHNDRAWVKASAAWLQQYPFCVLCLVRGRVNEGADLMPSDRQRNLVVDHIMPHRGSMDLFWDQDNWETLCRCPCHDVVKQRHERQGKTAEQWYAMLREESEKRGTQGEVVRLIPEAMRLRMYADQGGGVGGVRC